MNNIYSKQDHEVWQELIVQQLDIVKNVACKEYLDGLNKLNLPINEIPKIDLLSKNLFEASGWSLVRVNTLIPNRDFFNMLANKKFPVIQVIRSKEEINFYTSDEPDVFHELFGHCPMIMNKKFSDIMYKLGKFAINADDKTVEILGKLFWVMFEFGIIDNGTTKVFGAGILPSKDEINRVMNNHTIQKIPLNAYTKLDINIQGGVMQPVYYTISSLDELYKLIDKDLEKLIFFNTISRSQYCSTFIYFKDIQAAY